jgi:hypothetical protein
VFKATVVHGSKPERERALTTIAHLVAVVCAATALWWTYHYASRFAAPSLLLCLLAAGLGYVGGYLSVALVLLLLWLTTAAAALVVSSVILGMASVLTALSLLVPKPHGEAMRAKIGAVAERAIGAVFEPVFRLRGVGPVARWRKPRRHEGLRPERAQLPAPSRAPRFEGTLARCTHEVALADVRAPIVGVAGFTVGARVEDALVAPFELETAEGRLRVEVSVGEVVFTEGARRELLLRELPLSFGVARARRRPEAMPPNEPVAVFSAREGSKLRVEGGELVERAASSDLEGYRESSFSRALRGTSEHPVRITVLE